MKLGEDLIVKRHLISADWAPIRRIKRENQGIAVEVTQGNQLVGGTVEFKLRRRRTSCECGSGMLLLLFRHGLKLLGNYLRAPVSALIERTIANQSGNCSFRNSNVLFNGTCAGSHSPDDVPARHDG